MLQLFITKLSCPFYIIANEGEFLLESREDDIEDEADENEEDEETNEDNESNGDEHEGGERMPDLGEDVFSGEEGASIAECF